LAQRKSVRAADLQDESFVDLTRQRYTRQCVDAYCRSMKLRRHVTCEVNELTTLFDLVARGMGVAITASRMPAQYSDELRPSSFRRPGCVSITAPSSRPSPAANPAASPAPRAPSSR
jgi:DNA-binding transcriptional LysR family regulator